MFFILASVLIANLMTVRLNSIIFGGLYSLPAIFSLYWSFCIIIPVILAPDFYLSITALVYITLFSMLGSLGAILSYSACKPNERYKFHRRELNRINEIFLLRVIIVFSLLALGINLIDLLRALDGFDSLFSFQTLITIAKNNAGLRYAEGVSPPIIISFALALCYSAAAISGLVASKMMVQKKTKPKVMLATPIFVLFSVGMLHNTKATILYGLVMWCAGYLSFMSWYGIYRISINQVLKSIIIIVVLAIILVNIFVLMQMVRYGIEETSYMDAVSSLKVYALGYLGGFSYWFDVICCDESYGLGVNTFAGLTNILLEDIQGASPAQIPKYLAGNIETNVDTIFSDMIHDYGIYGSLLFALSVGSIIGVLEYFVRNGSIVFQSLLVVPYATILWAFTTSLANYSSIVLAGIFYFIVFIISVYLKFPKFKIKVRPRTTCSTG